MTRERKDTEDLVEPDPEDRPPADPSILDRVLDRPQEHPGEYRCTRCKDAGWLYLSAETIRVRYPITPGMDPAEAQRMLRKREQAEGSVYPCPACRHEQFERWSGGHLASSHVPARCQECIAKGWAPKSKRRTT